MCKPGKEFYSLKYIELNDFLTCKLKLNFGFLYTQLANNNIVISSNQVHHF